MIVGYDELARLRHSVVMVDGCFDPIHRGHIEYFRQAAELGPLLCNVASDDYVRTKHAPLLPQGDRAAIIDALRYVTYTHIALTSTPDVLRHLQPLKYVKGRDWRGRLPAEQLAIAAEHNIEVVYLDTVLDSSREILGRFLKETVGEGGHT